MNIEQVDDDDDMQVVQHDNDLHNDNDLNNEEMEISASSKKKKDKFDKDKNSQRSNIQWTDNLVCHLLSLVISEKAHLARKSKSSRLWDSINDAFYDHSELIEYRADLYKFDDHRKIRDKYRNIITAAKNDDDYCAVTKSGEVLRQNELIKQIIFEMNNHRYHDDDIEVIEIKRKKGEVASRNDSSSSDLLQNERIQLALSNSSSSNTTVIAGNKDDENEEKSDASVAATAAAAPVLLNRNVNSSNNRTSMNHNNRSSRSDYHHHNIFDAVVTRLLNEISTNNDRTISHESKVEEQLLKWITDHQKNIQSLLRDSNIHNADESVMKSLTDLTLEVIINIYCSRNHGFSPTVFKSALIDDMKVAPVIVHKIYLTLEKWRKLCYRVGETGGGSSSKGKELNMNVKITFN